LILATDRGHIRTGMAVEKLVDDAVSIVTALG
jgi:hypothetical protein